MLDKKLWRYDYGSKYKRIMWNSHVQRNMKLRSRITKQSVRRKHKSSQPELLSEGKIRYPSSCHCSKTEDQEAEV